MALQGRSVERVRRGLSGVLGVAGHRARGAHEDTRRPRGRGGHEGAGRGRPGRAGREACGRIGAQDAERAGHRAPSVQGVGRVTAVFVFSRCVWRKMIVVHPSSFAFSARSLTDVMLLLSIFS